MRGTFKLAHCKMIWLMKTFAWFAMLAVLLLLGMGAMSGLAAAELTVAQQLDMPEAAVGQSVTVTVMLLNMGGNGSEASVTPVLPYGIVTSMPYTQSLALSPGISAAVSYPIYAQTSGSYMIASLVSYTEDGLARTPIQIESPFSATGGEAPIAPGPEQMPGIEPQVEPMPALVPGDDSVPPSEDNGTAPA